MAMKLPPTTKKGYELAGEKAEALLLHGYTGSPYDLKPMASYLSSLGVLVNVPLLKGHGTKPRDLFSCTAEDWLTQASIVLEGFNEKKPLILGGLSMGALMAIILAGAHKKVRGLLLFSPALKLTYSAQLTIISAKLGVLDKNFSFKKLSGESDINDPIARMKTPAYPEMPVAGLLEFEKLRVQALDAIKNVTCPIFLAFGKHDSAINAYDSHEAIVGLARTPLVAKFYDRSKHVITLDFDRERLCNDVSAFLSEMCGIAL